MWKCRQIYLAIEFGVIFLLFPGLIYVFRVSFGRVIIPSLIVIAGICLLLLLKDKSFDRQRLWNSRDFRKHFRQTIRTFIPGSILLIVLVWYWRPDLLFEFPRSNTRIWLMVMVLYPLLSVYPQEVIFRTFFFQRYQSIFPNIYFLILISGFCFGVAHIFFGNWIAPLLSFAGGILFATTYRRSGSTLQVVIEHGLWGDLIFTIGLGWYFYGGSIAG